LQGEGERKLHERKESPFPREECRKGTQEVSFESTLNEKQRGIMKKFLSSRSRPDIYLEEDCCGSRDYHFEIRPSGIGDDVHLVCKGERVWLDDGLEA
jgi:hypothetical protein